ncbi:MULTISPECIES: helix-turn-helix transcriptional regulator [unclassified Streptomyces]|uniref:helix-turn-helix domain-containing protein n=1 Tax=unclassified Streptomyces TaxID=2593676 RepID=UPI0003710726|nr:MULTISPECIES: helix-turn-helix transcriptional regulator [unclassified Streptomyces]MYS38609.1 helix-turn-helix domain-containing protein [Streptomyces sp. SID4920]MYX66801.1 helix-turn-helix domain-containing protein [Streptomyces sp. SID8373]
MVNRKELDPEQSPRAAFGALLRRLREERGWTQDDLGDRMGCSGAHISAVETGRRAPTQRFAASADRALATGDQLRRASRTAQHRSLLEGFPEYVDHEARAVEIRLYEVGVIPGLLQTHEYAAALGDSTVKRGVVSREHADERIALIAQRQAAIARTPAPLIVVVLDESCLLRPIGDGTLMDAQFQRLIEFSELPNTVLQVAPFSIGVRRPMTLPVTVLTMPDRSLMSYAESANRGHLERDNDSVVPILTAYHQLQAESLQRTASVAMISKLRKGTL